MAMKDWKSSLVYFWFLKAMGFLGVSADQVVTD